MKKFFLFCALACLAPAAVAQEQAVLTTPISTTQYRVVELRLRWNAADDCFIGVELRDNNDIVLRHSYYKTEACTMLIALNKANLTSNSLQRRVLDRLITDKVIAASVTGTPE